VTMSGVSVPSLLCHVDPGWLFCFLLDNRLIFFFFVFKSPNCTKVVLFGKGTSLFDLHLDPCHSVLLSHFVLMTE
jgi:hypothetical protein